MAERKLKTKGAPKKERVKKQTAKKERKQKATPQRRQEPVTPIERIRKFLKDVAEEYKRVVWPSYQEVVQASIVVIVIMVGLSIYMYAVDVASSKLIRYLQDLFSR